MTEIQQTGLSLVKVASVGSVPDGSLVSRSGSTEELSSGREREDVALQESMSSPELKKVASEMQLVVNEVADTAVTFSVEEDLSRMVVAVRAVGSDTVIRQFPPEEFLTVAKFIAAQENTNLSEDFLKGILFDTFS